MEGLSKPDKLEVLWEQSKAKKLWDESQRKSPTQLDQYLSKSHPTNNYVPIEDYMGRWCNVINQSAPNVQTLNSPTPEVDHRMPQLFSSRERDNLDNYNKFMNELSVRIEGGWPPPNTLPYDEDLRHTLGLSPRVKTSDKFYPDSDKHYKRSRLTQEPVSNKKIESDQKSTSTGI